MASIGTRQPGLPIPPIPWKTGFQEDMNTPMKLSGRPQNALLMPKRKPLPSVFALGKCPPKPQRPTHINCDVFRRNATKSCPTLSETNNTELFLFPPPPPLDLLSITSETPPPPDDFTFPPAPPSLDPDLLEDYDDVEFMNTTQPSLGKSSSDLQESNEETYDDCDSCRPEPDNESSEKTKTNDSKAVKKRLDKDEKKRLEQEKKEKKLQEKREQEARKKFKIKGPIMAVSTVKANIDRKRGKNKLPLKRGETMDIIRKTENPKSYWLARNREGHYGFVKPDTVDECTEIITDNVLYVHNNTGTHDHLQNLPAVDESESDVYECVEEDFSFPPPPPDLTFNSEVGDTDDVVSSTHLHPPPSSDKSTRSMDETSKKCFEKEEKDFRKQFKYKGKIRVLYQATVLPSLPIKMFGNKDLVVKPGEIIDVIDHPAGDKIIGRNSKGKFGYVSTANIEEDNSVYDDVGEECIYDND
ncbi:FYN-binding protein 1 [Triplophysa dalaica]|uniref:FYN-binding protein 1 n=1 Tax=Triplophysa dalaica TaxID=1582913 RepID=UPI0024DFC3F0|nr:FYN-binding protein 1 [Triplophysa dalaica]